MCIVVQTLHQDHHSGFEALLKILLILMPSHRTNSDSVQFSQFRLKFSWPPHPHKQLKVSVGKPYQRICNCKKIFIIHAMGDILDQEFEMDTKRTHKL